MTWQIADTVVDTPINRGRQSPPSLTKACTPKARTSMDRLSDLRLSWEMGGREKERQVGWWLVPHCAVGLSHFFVWALGLKIISVLLWWNCLRRDENKLRIKPINYNSMHDLNTGVSNAWCLGRCLLRTYMIFTGGGCLKMPQSCGQTIMISCVKCRWRVRGSKYSKFM